MKSNDAPFQQSLCQEEFVLWQKKIQGTNISSQTLLATDYLNHFNEIVMLIDMVPDMPELLEECCQWRPKGYIEHFQNSAFPDRDLAIAAYDYVPVVFRHPFENTLEQMNGLVDQSLRRLKAAADIGDHEILESQARAASHGLQRLMDVVNAIIHGSSRVMAQDEIDQILGG